MATENDERVRPTASNRAKRKAVSASEPQEPESQLEQQPEHVGVEDDDLVDSSSGEEEEGDEEKEQDEGEEEGEGEEKEGDEEGVQDDDDVPNESEAIPSPPLLKGFQTHVAKQIYQGVQRDPLRCHSHVAKLLAWNVDDDNGAKGDTQGDFRQIREALRRAKLLRIRHSSYKNPNRNLISAFVERWHPETNSFHLPFGEMTITLDDVFCLTGLRVDGDPVQPSPRKKWLGNDDLEHFLGLTKKEATEALGNGRVRTSSVQLTWLRKKFMPMMKSDNEDEVLYAARAYVLYTFGTTLFADKSRGRVSTSWLEYTADMAIFHKYAWGTATLAYLYRQLGLASQSNCRQIGGYLTLLEAWIYERFSGLILPPQNGDFTPNLPVSMKYAPEAHTGSCMDRVRSFRECIDNLLPEEISWTPFSTYRDFKPFQQVSYFVGCIVSRDIVEPYMPDRVLRQFGYVQTVPPNPLVASSKKGGKPSKRTRDVWGVLAQYFAHWDTHVLTQDRLGDECIHPWDTSDNYMDWFISNSHPYVSNPSVKKFPPRAPVQPAAEPWEIINIAKRELNTLVQKWRSEVITFDEVMQSVEQTIITLNGPELAGPSSREGPGRPRGITRARGRARGRKRQG